MKNWIKRIILVAPVLLCAFYCQEPHHTTFIMKNMTGEPVVVKADPGAWITVPTTKVIFPEETFIIHNDTDGGFLNIHAIYNKKISLSTTDGTLLRYWNALEDPKDFEFALNGCYASYFKDYGVRQLHDEKEWTRNESGLIYDGLIDRSRRCEFTFNILPEDLIPLSEIVEK